MEVEEEDLQGPEPREQDFVSSFPRVTVETHPLQ